MCSPAQVSSVAQSGLVAALALGFHAALPSMILDAGGGSFSMPGFSRG